MWEQGFEDCLLACKGNTVQYTAVCSNTVTQYSWTIIGASSVYYMNQNRTAVVTWGNNNDVGYISVNVVTSDTNTCTAEACVLLMESPTINSQTIPMYHYEQEKKVIEVCLDETIELIDLSTAGQTPIVGYQWITPFGDASTPNHTIVANQTGEHTIKHYVQNECGCEGYEDIIVRVLEPVKLELSCYGTVCAGSNESYTLLSPYCFQYMWSVEGGTYTSDPSDPSTINVQWGNPSSGYGIISIDASFCDSPCQALTSIKIPIISRNTAISGPDVVCVGDFQLFELPIWGSTNYQWNISPSVGNSDMVNTEEINQVLLRFQQTGTYTLKATYECEFLNCGPFTTTKTIVVKDTMSINSSDNTLCKGATGHYTTWHGNSVTWRVYNQNNAQIYYTNGVALNYTFVNSGRYKIVASNSNYCDDAEYLVTVLDNPPALTITNGPHSACPNSSILLSATPTHPNYFLEWVQLCAPYNTENGDEVTIDYGNTVCNVAVYQIDGENNCRSDAYIHNVNSFQLAPHGLPAVTVACAGSIVRFTVPHQSNVTYEWTISPANAASIIGNHLSDSVNILTNHLYNVATPYMVNVTLKRTYCDDSEVYETVQLQIQDVSAPSLLYVDTVCQYALETLSAVGGTSVDSHYTWQFSDTTLLFHGMNVSRTFNTPGQVTFTLTYQPDPNCDPVVVHGQLYVKAAPVVVITRSGNTLEATYQPGWSYVWTHNGSIISTTSTYSGGTDLSGTYCCSVSTNSTPSCTTTVCYTIPIIQPDTCIHIQPTLLNQSCNIATVSPPNLPGLQPTWSWTLSTYANGSYCTPTQSQGSTTAYFFVPGTHYVNVYAENEGQCYSGSCPVTVNCVPRLELSYNCNGYIIVTDNSLYRSGFSIPDRVCSITGVGSTNLENQSMRDSILIGNPTTNTTYTINMTFTDGSGCSCSESINLEPDPVITSVNIPNKMCTQTPFLFSANAVGNNLQFHWDFGDNSYNIGNGIYHSYDVQQYTNPHLVLTITNNYGCIATLDTNITVGANNLSGTLTKTASVCPGNILTISYTPHLFNNTYVWSHDNSSTSPITNYQYSAVETGDYKVLVTNSLYGCKLERMINVSFLNAPTARITGNTTYCLGEEVKLNGNTGITNQYSWTITDPNNNLLNVPNSANITFTPMVAGAYSVTLVVTSPDGCSKTATCTVTVHQQPAAPPIAFYNNECIHTPPVYVHSTVSPAQNLLWSNGFHGSSAQYYVPGYLTAHYIDPSTGCPSAKSTLFIPPAPNYDALLTGCYERCKEELADGLHVYNFYPYHSGSFHWFWYENNNLSADDYTLYADLPLGSFSDYYMSTQYGNGCLYDSPILTITEREICPCEGVTVTVDKECEKAEECSLFYYMTIKICNTGSQTLYFDQLYTNTSSNIQFVNSLPVAVAPGTCETVYVGLNFTDFANPFIEFTLFDTEHNCEKTFIEYFEWEKCIEEECEIELEKLYFLDELSTPHQTSYFNFDLLFPGGVNNILSMWSTPSQIINYTCYPPTNVNGLLMLNYGQLSQMAMQEENQVCIHAIICTEDNKLCYVQICFTAEELFGMIPEEFRQLPDSTTADNDSTRSFQSSSFIPQTDKPYLAPNPARDEVTVMGIAPEEVADITVLTMQGGQVADFRNDYRFNVSRLAKASYIVRVVTTDKQVYYLKLVKQ